MTVFLPRQYQLDAVNSVFNYFFNGGKGNPVLAMPTGSGKAWVATEFIRRALTGWPNQRMLYLVHVKELVEQSYKTMLKIWPLAPAGVHSAGLKQRDTLAPIIFGGVASVAKKISEFGHVDVIVIDEAHMLSTNENSMYQKIIFELKKVNPFLKVVGLSATPFRLGQGMITDAGVFTDICFDITGYKEFNKLIADGYLAPLIPKRTKTELDISNVEIQNGDFVQNQLQIAVDKAEITHAALKEMIAAGHDRKSWLVFASGVDHADHIEQQLNSFGIPTAAVHSKMPTEERDKRILDFKSGKLRCAVSMGVLTTGFDHPPIDLIGMLRPTMSPGLWVQMLGRATRPSPGKTNALVLDFAGNTPRLGPINDPVIPKRKGKSTGEIPIRICEDEKMESGIGCGTYNHLSARVCDGCGAKFKIQTKITKTASTQELLKGSLPIVEYFDVQNVIYKKLSSAHKPPMLKVSYTCGLRRFDEVVCLEHKPPALHFAHEWWRKRHASNPPPTVDAALDVKGWLRIPQKIKVWCNAEPYPKIMEVVF